MTRRERRRREPDDKPLGIPCPACRGLITIRVDQLLGDDPIACGLCGLALSVDTERSAPAIDIVRQVADAMRQVEAVKHQRL